MNTRDKVNSITLATTLLRAMTAEMNRLKAENRTRAQERRLQTLTGLLSGSRIARFSALAVAMVVMTGCSARGYELGGKLGFYEADERTETVVMHREAPRSLTCKLTGYGCPTAAPQIVRGS